MASLGLDLKKEREMRGISLKEISDSTKISLRFLRALEEDQLDLLPGRFFIKGILRSYADYLGMDESTVLNKFYEEEQYRAQDSGEKQKNRNPVAEIPKSFRNKMFFGISFFVIVAVLSSLYFIFQKDKKDVVQIQSEPATAQKEAIVPPPQIEKTPAEETAATEMELAISFQQDTWIQIYIDGELLQNGIKYPGEEFKATAATEIFLIVGNAGGLTYSINQKPGKSLGRTHQVVRNIQITLDNLKDYLVQDEEAPGGQ